METLFDEPTPGKATLQILTKEQKSLTKAQTDFNKITAKIQKLEKELVEKESKLGNLLQYYGENISPLVLETQNIKIEFCFALDKAAKENKLSKKIKEQITDLIITFFSEVFEHREPTKEEEDLYDAWSDMTYKEELEEQNDFAKNMFSDFVNSAYGVDLDLEDLDFENPEGFEKMKNAFDEKMNAKAQQDQYSKPRKKTKKQLEKEEILKAEEELKTKNIRSIYISLTKVLHPDAESDTVLKQEKEEIMKQVTTAYEQKDLSTLLKLEMEWVHKTTEYLSELSEQKLKIYVLVMRERARQLEVEKYQLSHHPRFEPVSRFYHVTEKVGKKHLDTEIMDKKKINKIFRQNFDLLHRITDKKELNNFIGLLHTDFIEEDDFFEFGFL